MYRIDGYDVNIIRLIGCFIFYLVIAVGEEIIFRGIIFRMIAERWNVVIALVVSSLLFGAMHIANPNASIWTSVASVFLSRRNTHSKYIHAIAVLIKWIDSEIIENT